MAAGVEMPLFGFLRVAPTGILDHFSFFFIRKQCPLRLVLRILSGDWQHYSRNPRTEREGNGIPLFTDNIRAGFHSWRLTPYRTQLRG